MDTDKLTTPSECGHERWTNSGIMDGACQMLRCLDCGALDKDW